MRKNRESIIPIFSRRVFLLAGALLLLLAAAGAAISFSRSPVRKEIENKKVNEAALVTPTPAPTPTPSPAPKAAPKIASIPVPVSVCFNPKIEFTAGEKKVMRGAIISLSTPGVTGGFNYGGAQYRWTASAGSLTQNGKTAKLDTNGIKTDTRIEINLEAKGKQGQCKASGKEEMVEVTVPYHPPLVSLGLGEVTPADPAVKREAANAICAGDKVKLRANSSDADLSYDWKSTGGKIVVEGADATFDSTGASPGVHSVMVWARNTNGVTFDSKPIIIANCTQERMLLDECPQRGPLPATTEKTDEGVTFSIGRDGTFPIPGKVTFNWTTSNGKIYGSGGVVWFDRRSASFARGVTVEVTVKGEKENCRTVSSALEIFDPGPGMEHARFPSCTFSRNSATLNAECRSSLRETAGDLRKNPGSRAYIDVYRMPKEIEGLELLRGKNIFDHLVARYGINPSRMIIRSGGINEKKYDEQNNTVDVDLHTAEADEPAPPGPAVVFFAPDQTEEPKNGEKPPTTIPKLQYQEEVKGDYPSRVETGEQETVALRFIRKLTTLPTTTSTIGVEGDRTKTAQTVKPVPGRDQTVPLEEAMGEEYEPWIKATLTSSIIEAIPKSAEMADWRKLSEEAEVVWEWTIKTNSQSPLQKLKAEIEIEWRLKDEAKGKTAKQEIRHKLWEDDLPIGVDSPLLKQRQIKTATPIFSVTGLAFIVAGALPRRRKKEGEGDDEPEPLVVPPPVPAPASEPARAFLRGAAAPNVIAVRAGKEGDESNAQQDLVECSVFAPPAVARGATPMVQVFAHLREQAEEAARMAAEFDEAAKRRAVKTLSSKIARGSELMFDLTIANWQISDPVQTLVWNGNAESAQFIVDVPPDCKPGNVAGKVTVSQNSVPLGHISFILKVAESAEPAKPQEIAPAGNDAKRYSYAFVSYASADRSDVLERVQMLETMGIKYFQDVLSLDPGDRWEKKLYENIDKCDLFLLFWSRSAKESQWVLKEVEYAMARKRGNDDAPPEIKPVIIEGPPLVTPPDSLGHLHFNDRLIYFIQRK